MTDRAAWPRLLLIAALLAALGLTSRSGQSGSREENGIATACELNPPREIDGLERCLALNPRDIELMLDLGSLYEAGRRLDRAEELYRLGLSVDPKDGDVHVRLGRLLLERGDRPAAAREAREALAFQPQSPKALDLLDRAGHRGTQ